MDKGISFIIKNLRSLASVLSLLSVVSLGQRSGFDTRVLRSPKDSDGRTNRVVAPTNSVVSVTKSATSTNVLNSTVEKNLAETNPKSGPSVEAAGIAPIERLPRPLLLPDGSDFVVFPFMGTVLSPIDLLLRERLREQPPSAPLRFKGKTSNADNFVLEIRQIQGPSLDFEIEVTLTIEGVSSQPLRARLKQAFTEVEEEAVFTGYLLTSNSASQTNSQEPTVALGEIDDLSEMSLKVSFNNLVGRFELKHMRVQLGPKTSRPGAVENDVIVHGGIDSGGGR